jgi:uncharacterized LabA/DUF88 family protein
MHKDKTWVYIDSFNLYYGALNNHGTRAGLKWLDLENWLSKVLSGNDVQKIKFFTARVSGKYDPTKPIRQENYFRALRTLKKFEMIEGTFLFKNQKIHITQDVNLFAKVPEEKGTDVNLGIHLVNDAHNKMFETAVVVSNDSDLAGAVKIVTQELKLKVGILNPYPTFTQKLKQHASFLLSVREKAILKSQFPSTMTDANGTFTKPIAW